MKRAASSSLLGVEKKSRSVKQRGGALATAFKTKSILIEGATEIPELLWNVLPQHSVVGLVKEYVSTNVVYGVHYIDDKWVTRRWSIRGNAAKMEHLGVINTGGDEKDDGNKMKVANLRIQQSNLILMTQHGRQKYSQDKRYRCNYIQLDDKRSGTKGKGIDLTGSVLPPIVLHQGNVLAVGLGGTKYSIIAK